ncbi:SDR family oxidoreductase, partial [Elusimicrobiota bacterium]
GLLSPSVQLGREQVLHLAAETDVDLCETDREHAYRTNALATENLAKACKETGALMIYISTGGVFDGNNPEPYTEYDAPGPLSVYARTKMAGEDAVRSLLESYFIVRAGWMIGGGLRDKKFVYKMLRFMGERDRIQAVDDKRGTLTYAKQMLLQIVELLKTDAYGVYHAANSGVVTRYDVVKELARIVGSPVKIEPVGSAVFPLPAPRARSEAMRNYRLELMGINVMSDWKRALAEYLEELERVGVVRDGRIRPDVKP